MKLYNTLGLSWTALMIVLAVMGKLRWGPAILLIIGGGLALTLVKDKIG